MHELVQGHSQPAGGSKHFSFPKIGSLLILMPLHAVVLSRASQHRDGNVSLHFHEQYHNLPSFILRRMYNQVDCCLMVVRKGDLIRYLILSSF